MFEEYGMNSYQGATMSNFFGVDASNDGVIRTAADLQGQGLMNGDLPASVYSLYGNHGTMYNGQQNKKILKQHLRLQVLQILNRMSFLLGLSMSKEEIIIGGLDLWAYGD